MQGVLARRSQTRIHHGWYGNQHHILPHTHKGPQFTPLSCGDVQKWGLTIDPHKLKTLLVFLGQL
jgi:hypothetical protein